MPVCLSQLSTAAAACGGFAAVGPVGKRHRSIAARTPAPAAGAPCSSRRAPSSTAHHSMAVSSKAGSVTFTAAVEG